MKKISTWIPSQLSGDPDKPLICKNPTIYWVSTKPEQGDLFFELNFFDIKRIIDVIEKCPQHTFVIKTSYVERMRFLFSSICHVTSNLWIGVSVRNQDDADCFIPQLLEINASVRFLICDPLLSKINVRQYLSRNMINWVIVSGETGKNSRPTRSDWIRSIEDQCKNADVPFFFKQWGDWCETEQAQDCSKLNLKTPCKIIDINPESFCPVSTWKIGNKRTGRLLDGVLHDGFPNETR
jgi:protein gp37